MEEVKQTNNWDKVRKRIDSAFDAVEAEFKDFIEENLDGFAYMNKDIKNILAIYKKERNQE